MGKYRRRVNINSGLDAFSQAYGITRGVMKDYQAGKAEDEIATLGSDAGAVEGEGYTVTAPDGTTSTGLVSRDSGADFDAIQQAYGEQGYKVERQEKPMFAARGGEGKDYSLHDTEAAAETGSRKANHGLMRKKADVYQQHGMREESGSLRREARQGERQDSQDAMALEQHGQQMKLGKLKVDEAEAAVASKQRVEQAFGDFNQRQAAGEFKNVGDVRKWAADMKLSPDEQWQIIGAANKTDTAIMENVQKSQQVAMRDAYRKSGGNLQKFLDLTYNDEKNKLFADGRTAKVVRGKSGVQIVDSDGVVLATGADDTEAIAVLTKTLDDPLNAYEFQQKLMKHRMETRKTESEIRENNAQAGSALASAAKTRAETGVIRQGGGLKPDDVRQNTNAAVKQVLLATGLAKQDPTGNLFMQALDGKPGGSSEQEIARISAQAEELVRQGVPPYKAAEQVIQGRKAATPAPNPNRRPLSHFAN